MFEQRVEGTYYEIGVQIGEKLKDEFRRLNCPPRFSKKILKRAEQFYDEVNKFAPELIDEINGVAEGAEIDPQSLITWEITPYRNQTSCMVLAFPSTAVANGHPIMARNHEWIEEDSENLLVCYTKPKQKIPSLGFTFVTMPVSRFGGVNKAGLAISGASTNFVNEGPGLMFNLATRWVLDNCSSIDEAVDFIEKVPKTWGMAHLLMDSKSNIVKVEAHRKKTKITRIIDDLGYVSLLFDSPEMLKYNRTDDFAQLHFPRKKYLNRWFQENKGKFDPDLIIQVLRDHTHSICTHSPLGNNTAGICWSWIVTLGLNEALVCVGPPCKNDFRMLDNLYD